MKTLLVMRHAKASWKNHKMKDRDRPLTKRGKKDALQMGELIKEKDLMPQFIVSSSAIRASETTDQVIAASGYQGEVTYLDHLFMAEWDVILDALRLFPDSVECALIVGHNPGLEGVVQRLDGKVDSLPPAGLAYLSLPVNSWKDLQPGIASEPVQIWKPKELETSKTGKSEKELLPAD